MIFTISVFGTKHYSRIYKNIFFLQFSKTENQTKEWSQVNIYNSGVLQHNST